MEDRRPPVSRGVLALTTIRGSALGLNLLTSLALGRVLGLAGYGAYIVGMGLATIASTVATVGGPTLLVRDTASYLALGRPDLLRGLLIRITQAVVGASIIVGAVAALLLLAVGEDSNVDRALVAGAAVVPLFSLAILLQSVLLGLERYAAAVTPNTLVRPVVLLALVALAGSGLPPEDAVLLHGAAMTVVIAIGIRQLVRHLPVSVREATPAHDHRVWARAALVMGLSRGLTAIWASVAVTLAGVVGSATAAGQLGAASRIVVVVLVITWAANDAFQPVVARLYAAHQGTVLQQELTRLTRRTFAASLVVSCGVAVLAEPLLSLFGTGFEAGATALRLLCLAAVIDAAAPANMTVLLMSGEERGGVLTAGAGLVLTVVLALVLIPEHGATGGAIAHLAGTVVRNLLASGWTWSRLELDSTIRGASAAGRP